MLKAIKLSSPHYLELWAGVNTSSIRWPVAPLQYVGWCPQALQRPTSRVPPSHHRWHLVSQHLWSSACFYQSHIHSSHTCKLFIRTHHTKTPKLNRFALLCVFWNTASAQMCFTFGYSPLGKVPVFLLGHFLLWRWIQTIKLSMRTLNFKLSKKCEPIFSSYRYHWKQGLRNQKTQILHTQCCHLLSACAWMRLDFTCLALFFSSVM